MNFNNPSAGSKLLIDESTPKANSDLLRTTKNYRSGAALLAGVIMVGCGTWEVYAMEARITKQASYGTTYRATSSVTWHFPDFELRYLGTKNIQILKFTVADYQFVVRTQQGEIPISWNSGLGEIAPRSFKVDGRTYFLEMAYSELLGQWIKGKFVVYPDHWTIGAGQANHDIE